MWCSRAWEGVRRATSRISPPSSILGVIEMRMFWGRSRDAHTPPGQVWCGLSDEPLSVRLRGAQIPQPVHIHSVDVDPFETFPLPSAFLRVPKS